MSSRQQAAGGGRRNATALVAVALSFLAGAWVIGEPASQPALPSIQPVAYFQDNCSRCHGDYGSNYGDQFARNLDDAKLSKVVDDMCSGPGNAPLSGVDLQAEIAFHRALADHRPFVCIEKRDGQKARGEVTPGATLAIEAGGKSTTVAVDGNGGWSADLPADATLTATLKDQTTVLKAGESFSHAQPR